MKRSFLASFVLALALFTGACSPTAVMPAAPTQNRSGGVGLPTSTVAVVPTATNAAALALPTEAAMASGYEGPATATPVPSVTPVPARPTATHAPATATNPPAAPTATPAPVSAVGQVFAYSARQLEPIRGAVNFPPLMPPGMELVDGVAPKAIMAEDGQRCFWNEAPYIISGKAPGEAEGTRMYTCFKFGVAPHSKYTVTLFFGGFVYRESALGNLVYHSVYDGMMYNDRTPGKNNPEGVAFWGPATGAQVLVDYGAFSSNAPVIASHSAEIVPWTVVTYTFVNEGDQWATFGKGAWGKASGNGVNPPDLRPDWTKLSDFYSKSNVTLPVRGGSGLSDTLNYPGYSDSAAHVATSVTPWLASNGDTCWNVPFVVAGDLPHEAEGVSLDSCFWGMNILPGATYSATFQYASSPFESPTLDTVKTFSVLDAVAYDWRSARPLAGVMIEASVQLTVVYEFADGKLSEPCTGTSFETPEDVLVHWAITNPDKVLSAHVEQRAWGGDRGNPPICRANPELVNATVAQFEVAAVERVQSQPTATPKP